MFYDYLYFSQEFSLYHFNPNIGCHPHKTLRSSVGSGGHPKVQIIACDPQRTGTLKEGSLWFSSEYGQWWYGHFCGEKVSFFLYAETHIGEQ